MSVITESLEEVYKEAISAKYPVTEERLEAITFLAGYIPEKGLIYDLCPQQHELVDLKPVIKPLIPDKDMHLFLEELKPLKADLIIVRHVFEHSIMPYIFLKLLAKHTEELIIVIPTHTKEMIEYFNHYSVMNEDSFFNLLKKTGWKGEKLFQQMFNRNGFEEVAYKVTRK